jgi:hypothetical protein
MMWQIVFEMLDIMIVKAECVQRLEQDIFQSLTQTLEPLAQTLEQQVQQQQEQIRNAKN